MLSRTEAMSCCPVCLRQDVQPTPIESALPYKGGFEMENRTHSDSAVHFSCRSCGLFVVTECDCVNLKSPPLRSQWNPTHLSALLREQTIAGLPPFWLRYGMDPYGALKWAAPLAPIDLKELLGRWPRTVPERIDRTLCNLAKLSTNGGDRLEMEDSDTSLAFAETVNEANYIRQALIDQQLLDQSPRTLTASHTCAWLTPKGWVRFHELTHGKSAPQNPVFVAMWFGGSDQVPEMDQAFQSGIQPAIEQAGYSATRSDLVEHNDWIMDKILGDIRLAPFVVADFTEHRNGVYLEAGFARGLGIPVIHTCRADHMGKAHFDTAQLNHVVWNTPDDLRTKLYHRIVGTIGQGPQPRARDDSGNLDTPPRERNT